MNLQSYLFANSSFRFPNYLRFLLVICFTSTATCNDQQICKHFKENSQLILKATQWIVLSLFFFIEKPNKQKTFGSYSFNDVKALPQLPCDVAHLQSDPSSSPILKLFAGLRSYAPRTELRILPRMISYAALLLHLNFCSHLGLLLDSSSILPLLSNTLFVAWFLL